MVGRQNLDETLEMEQAMNHYAFYLANTLLHAYPDGSLWCPSKRILCVSDLHFGKSERIARCGGNLLPPYETRETLWRLEKAITAINPEKVICLGDSFDDLDAVKSASDETRATLARLQTERDWVWIEGNHDPGPVNLGGSNCKEIKRGELTFRHIAQSSTQDVEVGEISGHYHPKAAIRGARHRPCFLLDKARLIMPAFGTYTGGMSSRHTILVDLMSADTLAILTGKHAIPVPLAACTIR
ncbi:MAG: DNA ligase-associated metallophosphoesterase [Alteromonas macleodii]